MSSSFKLHVLSSLIVAAKSFSSLLDKVFVINLPNGKSYQLVFLAVNFLHLTGVKTSLKPKEFYDCCLNASLLPSDIDCESDPQIKDAVKGKMKNLISIGSFFSSPLQFQEDFIKGNFAR